MAGLHIFLVYIYYIFAKLSAPSYHTVHLIFRDQYANIILCICHIVCQLKKKRQVTHIHMLNWQVAANTEEEQCQQRHGHVISCEKSAL